MDKSYFLELASCYKAIGLRAEAEECYKIMIDNDRGNIEANQGIAGMSTEYGMSPHGVLRSSESVSVKKHKTRRRITNKSSTQPTKVHASTSWTMLAPRPAPQTSKQLALEKEQAREGDVHALFLRRQTFKEQVRDGDESSKDGWMAANSSLIQRFRDNRIFYPFDKHHKFYGYSKEARIMASRPKHELHALAVQSRSALGRFNGPNHLTLPQWAD